jgi:hypothetical protein
MAALRRTQTPPDGARRRPGYNTGIRTQATSRIWIGDLGVTHWGQDHDNGVDAPGQDAEHPPQ